VIKLHEGRHTAASLQRDAGIAPEIRRKTMGHAEQSMTDWYTHLEESTRQQAADAAEDLVAGAGGPESAAL
jgi:integrase